MAWNNISLHWNFMIKMNLDIETDVWVFSVVLIRFSSLSVLYVLLYCHVFLLLYFLCILVFLLSMCAALYRSPGCAPSILNMFIGMLLFTETPIPEGCRKDIFPHQVSYLIVFNKHFSIKNYKISIAILKNNRTICFIYKRFIYIIKNGSI